MTQDDLYKTPSELISGMYLFIYYFVLGLSRLTATGLDYKGLGVNDFDVIWASTPCTEYSRSETTGVRKIDCIMRIASF